MLLRTLWLIPWLASVRGDVRVGAAFNVFTSFGDLGALVKVKDQGVPWFPSYHSTDVFERVLENRSPVPSADAEFPGVFLLQLCDSAGQLTAALYADDGVEGVERPWRAYVGGWSRSVAAARLGVNSTFLLGAHGYALVRLTRHHEQVMLSPDYELRFNQWAADGASKVTPDQPATVFDFIGNFGSHYISSYITGDSLYQVFVFDPSTYEDLHKAMREYEKSGQGLDQVLAYFTPWHTEHIGRVVSVSGSGSVERWAEHQLRSETLGLVYPSLLRLHSAPELLRVLNVLLRDNAVLAVQLRSLAAYFPDERRRLWFSEVLDNHLKLWELSV